MIQRMNILAIALLVSAQGFAAEYIVKYKDGMSMNLASSNMMRVSDVHETANLIKINVPDNQAVQAIMELYSRPDVEYVVRNFKLKAFLAPVTPITFSTTALQEQWAIQKVKAAVAWQKAGNRGSKKVTVAVIDTGVDYNHESIKANAVPGYNFKDNNADPMDKTGSANPGHGTHCAGIIGATGTAEGGTIGISPDVSIMPLRFLGEDGSGDLMAGIKAIDFAIEKKVQVISASWGATIDRSQAQPLVDAVKRADDAGVIFISAAANDGSNNDSTEVYPANTGFPNTITVAASGPSDEKPSWSNFGKAKVHLASPGLNIMSTLPNNKYGNLSGTSMATPLVSGLVAFLKAQDPSLTGMEVKSLLQVTGAKVNIDTACNCRVDAEAAVTALLNKTPFVVPAATTLKINDTQTFKMKNASGSVKFASSNPQAATIDDNGLLKAVAVGETVITATDAGQKTAQSLAIRVTDGSNNGGGGGGGGGGSGDCPLGDQKMCDILCQVMPDAPFCKK